MPAGYSARCKVCNSGHRTEIEKWIKEEGLSPRQASAKLEELYGESISHKSIWRHMNEHFDVKAEAREQYQKSQQQFKQAVEKRLSDIEMLDNIAKENYQLYIGAKRWLDEILKEKKKPPPKALVDLVSVVASETRQQIKQKQELLGDDPESRKADAMVATLEELQELYLNAHSSQEEAE